MAIFTEGDYAIDVHGPNGFYRSFVGSTKMPLIAVHAAYERRGASLTGDVEVRLRNNDKQPHTITVSDNAYKSERISKTIAPGRETTVLLDLKKSHAWYDFTVSTEGFEASSRFAGRVETGRSGFSDPLMGAAV